MNEERTSRAVAELGAVQKIGHSGMGGGNAKCDINTVLFA